MKRYKCTNCGYAGKNLVYQFTDYTYCLASNEEEPTYGGETPAWVKEKNTGDGTIGNPVGCQKCHAWGVDKFEAI
ncbi:hypothetical protein COT30_02825 [Candidatus Micrarchaeota archaeon CG08_land_8_20_14_0_20_49_17]|nr:MAG: hypothetical protein AUJ13_03560 [Candidatus Micrarchaeota archaeon CG1_02_49_24]PIU09740.1 MAG: hypothetical protein COT30_02825 [Candidatus Micrarchaeota archaeon CG08_land_8_20_14_0_20_49_17]PIZ99201.1 MAG: hypothetical protein COX84_01300 [Candidatus Micrarchaeota archaeon CG_4_10_14_0_2_um_filter_49_7]HII54030.1 hypothetical protein [Candidatus Micrarchaeota archaeon]